MTIRFTAQVAGADEHPEDECISADGMTLTFQCCTYEPDDQDVALGFDTHCVVTANQGTAYGAVRELTLRDNVLRVVFAPDSLEALGLTDPEIEADLAVDEQSITRLRQGLQQILRYGRPDSHPQILQL